MAGRPTSYKPAYCNEVVECLAQGHSVAGFAGSIGVAASSVYKWIKEFPEFAEAYAIAQAKAIFFWEKTHIEITQSGKGNITGSIFGLKNRAAEEWRDVQKIEHGKPGEFDGLEPADQDAILRAVNEELARRESKAGNHPEPQPAKAVSSLH